MKFEIQTKNEDGSIIFQGTANQTEASFILEVGLNYLLAQGAMPLLTGNKDENSSVSTQPTNLQ